MKYLIVPAAFEAFLSALTLGQPTFRSLPILWRLALVLLLVLITVKGISFCYSANKGDKGRDFLKRYICLSVPVHIFIGVGLLLVSLPAIFFLAHSHYYGAFTFVMAIIDKLIFYVWLGYLFRKTNLTETPTPEYWT